MNEGLSNSDVALLADRGGDMMSGGNAFFWILALLILGGGGFGNFGSGPRGDYVTQSDLTSQLNAQAMQNQMQQLAVSNSDSNFAIAQMIHNQTNEMLQQNNANLINAIQGFNVLGLQITNQTNVLSQQLMAIDAKMSQCCCDIKTQMLSDRLDDTQAALVVSQNALSNSSLAQYLLGQFGRFVPWAGSGTQASTGT